jgi:hypothetical protein
MVTFSKPFVLNGRDGELPAGQYEILVEEELLHGLSVRRQIVWASERDCHQEGLAHLV